MNSKFQNTQHTPVCCYLHCQYNNTDVNSVDKNSAATAYTDCSDARFKKMFVICNTPAYKIVLEANVEHGQNKFTMSGKEKRSSSEGSNYYDDLLN